MRLLRNGDSFYRGMPCFIHWSDGISAVICMNVYTYSGAKVICYNRSTFESYILIFEWKLDIYTLIRIGIPYVPF